MIFIPLAAIVVMALFIIVYSKTFMSFKWPFKALVTIFTLGNLFFMWLGPHIVKQFATIVYFEDVWYIIAWSVGSMIITLSILLSRANLVK